MSFTEILGLQGTLGNIGFYNFILPFLLVFAIIFAILDSIDIFKRRSETLVAVIIALLMTSNPAFMIWYSHFTATMSMYFAVLAFGIILVLLIVRPFGGKDFFGTKNLNAKMLFFGAVIIVGLLMFSAGGTAPLPPGVRGIVGSISRADLYTLLVLGGIFILIVFTSSESEKKKTTESGGS